MRVLTPSGKYANRPTPTVAAEQKAIKAVSDAVSEFGPMSKGFLTGNAAMMGGGTTPGQGVPVGSRPSSLSNTGNANLNALVARVQSNLASNFQQTSPELEEQLARQGLSWGPPFPPGRPLDPQWGYRRPPRTWNFAVGENVQLTPRWNRISFQTLKALYDKYDVAQICVRHLIDDVRSLDVSWGPPKNCKDDVDEDIRAAEEFWAYPDRRQPFDCWLAEWLQDVLRYDAGALFIRETEAGDPYAVEVISGETIIPLIDYFGRRPADEEPDQDGEIEGHITPAFLQIIEGMPWDWLTSDQMIYQPLWPMPESQYGQCPLESIMLSANNDLRFQMHFLEYFTGGTLPAGFMEAPQDLSDPAQVQAWQEHWDALMMGDQGMLNRIRWVPAGSKFTDAKPGANTFDETFPLYLMRRTCAAYKVTPTDLGFTETVNRASSEIQVDVQARVGRGPLIQYVEGVVNLITSQRLKLRARLQIEPGGEIEDRVAVAQAHSIYIEKGVESPDEVRAELGKPVSKDRPFPRFIDNSRAGPITEIAIASQAGEVDPETYGRAEGQALVPTPYASPPGVLPAQGSPEQKTAAEHTAQASRDLIAATTGHSPPVAAAETPGSPGAATVPAPDEAAAKAAIAAVEPLGWHAVLAVVDALEKGGAQVGPGSGMVPFGGAAEKAEATGGVTAATGIQGVDLKGADDDEDEDTAKKAAEVALEMRRWRENARNRLKKGRAMRPFASTVLSAADHEQVWRVLKAASTREEVDAAFAGMGKPSAGERPAFHSQADRIVGHYTPKLAAALGKLFSSQQIHDAIDAARKAKELSTAEKAAVWDKSASELSLRELAYRDALLKDAQLDLAFQAAREALEAGSANSNDLATVLDALHGEGLLQGAHDAAAASGGTVAASLKGVEAAPASSYWNDWKPGYGEAASQAADGGMRDMLDQAGQTIQGLSDTSMDRIGHAISEGLASGDSTQTVAKAVADVVEDPQRAETIANTEYARAMDTASVQTYEEAGVEEEDWLAEDDACPECEANADGSPYKVGEGPEVPAHPECRCAKAPHLEGAPTASDES